MKIRVIAILMTGMLPLACSQPVAEAPESAATEDVSGVAREAIGEFGARLKKALMDGLAQGGPVAAIGVCNTQAHVIASAVGVKHGLSIGRSSLKVRNPANEPDEWQRATLLEFARALEDGDDPASLSALIRTDDGDASRYRYMQPIMTQPLCVTCHGDNLPADLRAKLAELYPQDKAVGYAAGDLRGAFTVEWPVAD